MGQVAMCCFLIQVTSILWLAVTCEGVCLNKCKCVPFDRNKTRIKVKCNATGYIPPGIPSNTVLLDLSGCSLNSISEDSFRHLSLLKKLNLSGNLLKFIPQNTFRNLTSLKIM
ncbi:uncharacterized protein LOC144646959 [Oculina patagonica]